MTGDGTLTSESLRSSHRRSGRVVVVLGFAMLLAIAISAGIGPAFIDPLSVLGIIGHHTIGLPAEPGWTTTADTIVWVTRMPRVLMGVAAGATLAVAGAALQAMVRNVLADPYILGVSSGASTGAAVAIIVLAGSGGGALLLSGSAFLGALAATMLVLLIGGVSGGSGPVRLIMAGMAVGYVLSAVTSFLVFASDSPEASRSVMFWLLGSLANSHWPTVHLALAVAAFVVLALTLIGGQLDALASGDEASLALGIRPDRARMLLMVVISLAVGVIVAGAGSIGFVGLVVPHLARGLVGARHRTLLPACAFLGAIFLLAADVLARMAFMPQEMPIGVVTGVVGAPLLLVLLRRGRSQTSARSRVARGLAIPPKMTRNHR
ncbi:FecCD family ABC transporter permease [Luethyella okanaganae]|uniref:FecCD family ABC transporter permease n=1 Tax=Luethyella okanaganae TaxID=69372 RepID=A0ABW1VI40_9MICO